MFPDCSVLRISECTSGPYGIFTIGVLDVTTVFVVKGISKQLQIVINERIRKYLNIYKGIVCCIFIEII